MKEAENNKVIDLRGKTSPNSTIIAVGAGKGGVGKSFLSSSLAYFLAQMDQKTLLVDLDIGAANLHTWLGEGLPKMGLNEFINDPNLTLKDVVHHTQKSNLSMITGATDSLISGDLTETQKSRLMSAIYNYSTDFIILDLGAGTHTTTLDFFLMAQEHIVIFTPEPSSIENAYRFMKAAFYRKLKRYDHRLELDRLIQELAQEKIAVKSPADLLRAFQSRFPDIGPLLEEVTSQLHFQIVLNQIRTSQDRQLGKGIRSVCQRHFGLNCSYLGALSYDNAVWQSLRQKKHLLVANPYSHLYAQIMGLARKLVDPTNRKTMVS